MNAAAALAPALPGPLRDAECAAFAEQGFLIVRRLAPESLRTRLLTAGQAHLAACVEPIEYEADTRYPGAPRSREEAGGHTARRLKQVYARDPAFREWARLPALTDRLKQLLGSPAIALTQAHHNSLMTKQPDYSSVTHWHRDTRYWSFEDSTLVSAWLALGHEFRENGCLGFIPGSHQLELGPERFEELAFLRPDHPENVRLIDTAVFPELEPGDVVFFHAQTLHAAGWNRTESIKWSLVFTYHRQDNHPLPDSRSASLPSILID
jgi:phytanoyl-CoA hydroxylase